MCTIRIRICVCVCVLFVRDVNTNEMRVERKPNKTTTERERERETNITHFREIIIVMNIDKANARNIYNIYTEGKSTYPGGYATNSYVCSSNGLNEHCVI
jgi:hypothetical protein